MNPFGGQSIASSIGTVFENAVNTIVGTLREIHGKNFDKLIDYYLYSTRHTALDNPGTSTQSIQINASSNFAWTHAVASVRSATTGLPFMAYQGAMTGGSVVPSWPIRVKLTDGGDQEDLQNQSVPLGSVFGDVATQGQIALPRARLWRANSTITVELTRFAEGQFDAAGAATNINIDADLVFVGYRLKIAGRQNLTAGI